MKLFNKVFYFFAGTKIYVLEYPKNSNEFRVNQYKYDSVNIEIAIYGAFSFNIKSKHFHIYSPENHKQRGDYKNRSLLKLFKDLKKFYYKWTNNRMEWVKIDL